MVYYFDHSFVVYTNNYVSPSSDENTSRPILDRTHAKDQPSSAETLPAHYQFPPPSPSQPKATWYRSTTPTNPPPFPDPTLYLQTTYNIPPNTPIALSTLPIPPSTTTRPPYTLNHLVQLAIYAQPNHRALLREIFDAIEQHFPYYRSGDTWKNSIRHLLSLEAIYVNLRDRLNRRRGGYWTLDVSKANQKSRPLQRRSRAKQRSDNERVTPEPVENLQSTGRERMRIEYLLSP